METSSKESKLPTGSPTNSLTDNDDFTRGAAGPTDRQTDRRCSMQCSGRRRRRREAIVACVAAVPPPLLLPLSVLFVRPTGGGGRGRQRHVLPFVRPSVRPSVRTSVRPTDRAGLRKVMLPFESLFKYFPLRKFDCGWAITPTHDRFYKKLKR